jgi:TonB family protein
VNATIVVNAAGEVTMAVVTSGPPELRASAFKSFMGLKYSPAADTVQLSVALEYRLDPQGWGVRVIQDSGTTSANLAGQATLMQKLQAVRESMDRLDSQVRLPVPVRVGGGVPVPKKTKDAPPVYPQAALEASVQGVVILEAVVDGAGNVSSTKVLRSIPLLDQAAVDAVMQWQYTPTLLNGVAVPVVMTVTVNFTMRKDIVLNIGLPSGGTMTLRIATNGGLGTLALPGVGNFAFSPVPGASDNERQVAIYQMGDLGSQPRLLGNVQVELNGGVVQSPTTPSFGIELVGLP